MQQNLGPLGDALQDMNQRAGYAITSVVQPHLVGQPSFLDRMNDFQGRLLAAQTPEERRGLMTEQGNPVTDASLGFAAPITFHGMGPFGPIWKADNWADVLDVLRQQKTGEVRNALEHPQIGTVSLPYGTPGTGKSDGYGLSKLDIFHPEYQEILPDQFPSLPISSETENRYQLQQGNIKGAVRKEFNGEPLNWLISILDESKRKP
ncbi:hypothetical protein [Telmatospirillum sp.]|uniref:hypothetical protein n=1 Tax=Telmatospirillum sp. TaxID=2079197 RepID=UPI00284AB3C0|nr:hypothetical protein [Telmatospirillum sp.]MDR3439872.1 hypothetical protein [Telmatospirillum sp.]